MNDAASQFAKSSGKLIYVFNPRANTKKEEQVSVFSSFSPSALLERDISPDTSFSKGIIK